MLQRDGIQVDDGDGGEEDDDDDDDDDDENEKPAVMFQSAFKIGKLNLLTKSKGSPWLFFTWPSSSSSPSTTSPSSSSFPGKNGL